jgi:aspartyl-tRNA(Asn)/glutamyl-tRNA(Gln) amidotransferase subunit A
MQFNRREFLRSVAASAAAAAVPTSAPAQGASRDEIASLTLAEVADKIRVRALTSVQVTESCLDRISVLEPKINAFITVMRENALSEARRLDAELNGGKARGILHGVPIAVKDNTDTAGTRTTGGSALFEDRIPDTDAPVVTRLKNAGAVIIGKTNLHEFAAGAGQAGFWGITRNPWSLDRQTGGSSTGSGAAVAADFCYGATGTDTAGSVRHPAAYCGIVGLKPTNGLVSVRGTIPLTLSLDTCGPLARRVEDVAIMLTAMAGYDKFDIMSVDHPREDYVAALKQPVSGFRIGLPIGHFDHIDPEIEAAFEAALDVLRRITAGVQECTLPQADLAMTLGPFSETYAWHEKYFTLEPGKYEPSTRELLSALANMKAAPYIRAMWDMERLRRIIDDSFEHADFIAFPTMHTMPEKNSIFAGPHPDTPRPGYGIEDSVLMNVYGIPAISIPCGFSKDGLPIGLEIAGPHFSEGRLLALAQSFERATKWHERKIPLQEDTPVPPQ